MPTSGWEEWEAAASGHRDSMMSLQELEPSPIESPWEEGKDSFPGLVDVEGTGVKTPKDEPRPGVLHRASTLGLSGNGGHGTVYYCKLQQYHMRNILVLTQVSDKNPAIFQLRLRNFYHLPHSQHICHTTHHTVSIKGRQRPPPHSTILPIVST